MLENGPICCRQGGKTGPRSSLDEVLEQVERDFRKDAASFWPGIWPMNT